MSWEGGQFFGRGGDYLRPIVGGRSGISISSINLISPNSPTTVQQLSSPFNPPSKLMLAANNTVLNPDGVTYWPVGESLWCKLSSPLVCTPSNLLTLVQLATQPFQSMLWIKLSGARTKVTNTGIDGNSVFLQLVVDPLVTAWDSTTLCWNNQPLNIQTAKKADGTKFFNAFQQAPIIYDIGTYQVAQSSTTDFAYPAMNFLPYQPSYSGRVYSSSLSTTTLIINTFPNNSGVQYYYNSQWNVSNNFIGATIIVTPYTGDLTRSPASSTVTAYDGTTGMLTFSPPLPWTPVNSGANVDSACVIPPIIGFSLSVFVDPKNDVPNSFVGFDSISAASYQFPSGALA